MGEWVAPVSFAGLGFLVGLGFHLLSIGRWTGKIDGKLDTINELRNNIHELKTLFEEKSKNWADVATSVGGLRIEVDNLKKWMETQDVRLNRLENSHWKPNGD